MKINKIKYGLSLIAILTISNKINAQESSKGYKETLEMTADEKGDIVVNSNITYNAAMWATAKQLHATESSVVKNNLKKAFPKNELTSIEVKNDEDQRATLIKFTLLGALKLNEDGKWMAELDSKKPDITKISETQFLLVTTTDDGGAQTLKINLPKSASNAKVEPDNFGKSLLTYNAPVSGGITGSIVKYLGFLTIAAGGFLFFKNRKLNTVVISNGQQQKINYQNTKHIDDASIVNEPMQQNLSVKKDIYGNRQ
jgi:VCBS repeat-containing protein